MIKKTLSYVLIFVASFVQAVAFHVFVFPNEFAPSGLNGICTMVQYLFHFNLGYLYILVNLPLAIAVYFLVGKAKAVRTFVYVAVFSVFTILLEKADLSAFTYLTDNGTSRILGPVVGGLVVGFCVFLIHKVGACGAGMEYVGLLVQKFNPHINFYWFAFALNTIVALSSYFVYGFKIEPVLLSIIYNYAAMFLRDQMVQSQQRAVRCEIITQHPDDISKAILDRLHHPMTMLPAKGVYQGQETNVLVCIINKTQVAELKSIISQFPNCFVSISRVDAVLGNFQRLDSNGNPEKEYTDPGLN